MTTTAIAPAIDHQLAQSILDTLDYTLQDLSIQFGDVIIQDGDISHQLYYGSKFSNANIIGYVRIENGIYYSRDNNHQTAEQAALDLLPDNMVQSAKKEILARREFAVDYI